ncbi:unnamed protein product [Ectocarpus sp. 8 AP-2014]
MVPVAFANTTSSRAFSQTYRALSGPLCCNRAWKVGLGGVPSLPTLTEYHGTVQTILVVKQSSLEIWSGGGATSPTLTEYHGTVYGTVQTISVVKQSSSEIGLGGRATSPPTVVVNGLLGYPHVCWLYHCRYVLRLSTATTPVTRS